MIDLRKAALLEAALELPYTFVMPNTLFEDEWLCLSDDEKETLNNLGLEVHDLPGPTVARAGQYFNQHSRLKLNDCFALSLAEDIEDCILLTGDGPLRGIADGNGIEVHGVLWLMDELESHEIRPLRRLHEALQLFHEDELVFLPANEVLHRMRRLAQLL